MNRYCISPDNGLMYESDRGAYCRYEEVKAIIAEKDATITLLDEEMKKFSVKFLAQHAQLRAALNYIECDCSEDENIPEVVWASIQAWPKIDSTALEAHDKEVRAAALEDASALFNKYDQDDLYVDAEVAAHKLRLMAAELREEK